MPLIAPKSWPGKIQYSQVNITPPPRNGSHAYEPKCLHGNSIPVCGYLGEGATEARYAVGTRIPTPPSFKVVPFLDIPKKTDETEFCRSHRKPKSRKASC